MEDTLKIQQLVDWGTTQEPWGTTKFRESKGESLTSKPHLPMSASFLNELELILSFSLTHSTAQQRSVHYHNVQAAVGDDGDTVKASGTSLPCC